MLWHRTLVALIFAVGVLGFGATTTHAAGPHSPMVANFARVNRGDHDVDNSFRQVFFRRFFPMPFSFRTPVIVQFPTANMTRIIEIVIHGRVLNCVVVSNTALSCSG